MDQVMSTGQSLFGVAWLPLWTLFKIICLVVPLILAVAYLTLAERKVIGYMQVRIGPNRVGPLGLLQPFADVLKMLFKEIIVPSGASRALFFIAPMLSLAHALAAWAVIPFTPTLVLSDINAGLLYILAMSSIGVYGVILAGWASNSKYAFLGALRSAAQIVSYEIAMGLAVISAVLMTSLNAEGTGTLSMIGIVQAQQSQHVWFVFKFFLRINATAQQSILGEYLRFIQRYHVRFHSAHGKARHSPVFPVGQCTEMRIYIWNQFLCQHCLK